MTDAPPPRVRMTGIDKQFGGVRALDGVDFEAEGGAVHAVCGENGAGKSTLMKVLAGVVAADAGAVALDGRPLRAGSPRAAEDAGVRMIHQELCLVDGLTAAANVFLGRERRRGPILDDRAMEARAAELFARLGAAIDPRAPAGSLRVGDRQIVEIARALAFDARVLIMDEPTSALSDAEAARLARVIGELRGAGVAVLYVSHKMNEVFALADRVTVLRDGRRVATADRREATPAQVVRWMVGRAIEPAPSRAVDAAAGDGTPRLEVRGLATTRPAGSSRPALRDVSFAVRAGEVVGVAGLLGAGRTELLEAIAGAGPAPPSGTILLDGCPVRFVAPADAIAAGVALVPEDRKAQGLFPTLAVRGNMTIATLPALAGPLGVVRRRAERAAVAARLAGLDVRAAGPEAAITSLSGGNQQKCLLGRWLETNPRLLLLDDPTRGVDVAAKAEIHALLRRLAAGGMGVLMTSSELPELLAACDRILVLCEGRLTAAFDRADATEEAILAAATAFRDRAPAPAGSA